MLVWDIAETCLVFCNIFHCLSDNQKSKCKYECVYVSSFFLLQYESKSKSEQD